MNNTANESASPVLATCDPIKPMEVINTIQDRKAENKSCVCFLTKRKITIETIVAANADVILKAYSL